MYGKSCSEVIYYKPHI